MKLKKPVYKVMHGTETCMCIHVYSGITSRCKSLIQAYELAKRYRIPNMVIIWQLDKWCNIKYEEVFAKEQFPDVHLAVITYKFFPPDFGEGMKEYMKRGEFGKLFHCLREWIFYFVRKCSNREAERLMDYFKRKHTYIRFDPSNEIGWNGKAYEQWSLGCWNRVKDYLEKGVSFCAGIYCGLVFGNDVEKPGDPAFIIFDRKYTDIVDGIVSGENWVGVHVRRTDHQVSIKESTLDCFIEKMKESAAENNKVRFFLATDDKEVEKELCASFPGRIFTYRNKVWGRGSKSGMESAIVDLLCLSRCGYILGSSASVFSDFAAIYGNCELVVCRK